MTALPHIGTVISEDGIQGRFEAGPVEQEKSNPKVWVKFVNGQQLWVPAEELILQAQGSYLLPLRLATLAEAVEDSRETQIIPVMEETLEVKKRQVETGGVRITKVVREHEEIVDEPLLRETVDVHRVTINQFIEAPVLVRFENDDTVIVPVFEEVLVVEKRLFLKEELHIRKRQTITHQPQTVIRRSEEVSVERFQPPTPAEDNKSSQ